MILRRVRLENFISHKSSELEFDYGINVIVGPNGAGKTSILDAISFALFNVHSRGKETERKKLINKRAEKAEVSIEFIEGGVDYAIDWTIDRKKPASGILFKIQNGEKIAIARGGDDVIIPEVKKIIGLDKNLFLQSIYVQQGEIDALVTATRAARKEIISKLLGIEDLEKAYQSMKSVIGSYETAVAELSGELKRKQEIEEKIKSLDKNLRELAASRDSKASQLREIEEELRIREEELKELERKEKQFRELNTRKAVLEKEIDNLCKQLESKEAELKKAEEAFEIVEKLKKDVESLPLVERYVNLLGEWENKKKDKEQKQETLRRIDSLRSKMAENEQLYQSYQENSARLKQIVDKRREYEGANELLRKIEGQLQKDKKQRDKKYRDLFQKLNEYSQILGEEITAENIGLVLSKKERELEELKRGLEGRADNLKREIGRIEEQLREVESKLSQISEADVCPICKRELTPEHRLKLQSEFEELRQKSNEKRGELEAEIERIDIERRRCEKKLKDIASVDPEIIRELAKEIGELDEKIAQEQRELEEVKRKTKALDEIDTEINRLKRELDELKEAYEKYEASKRALEVFPPRDEVESSLDQINREINAISKEIETLLNELGYKPEDPEKELKDLRCKKDEFNTNKLLAEKKDSILREVQKIRRDVEDRISDLNEVISSISALAYDEDSHRKKKEEHKDKEDERNKVRVEKAKIETEIEKARKDKEEYEGELILLQEKEKEKNRIESFVKILEAIRDAFHRDGIQRLIRARARPLLEKMTREIFEKFNFEFSDLQIDDDYDISVVGPAGVLTMDQISGGERVALAIALRLAIARILAEKVETVIMDEPTTHLDEERRKELVSVLNSFFREGKRAVPQMIVITHHHGIEDVADVIYLVKKTEEGYSSVESPAS